MKRQSKHSSARDRLAYWVCIALLAGLIWATLALATLVLGGGA